MDSTGNQNSFILLIQTGDGKGGPGMGQMQITADDSGDGDDGQDRWHDDGDEEHNSLGAVGIDYWRKSIKAEWTRWDEELIKKRLEALYMTEKPSTQRTKNIKGIYAKIDTFKNAFRRTTLDAHGLPGWAARMFYQIEKTKGKLGANYFMKIDHLDNLRNCPRCNELCDDEGVTHNCFSACCPKVDGQMEVEPVWDINTPSTGKQRGILIFDHAWGCGYNVLAFCGWITIWGAIEDIMKMYNNYATNQQLSAPANPPNDGGIGLSWKGMLKTIVELGRRRRHWRRGSDPDTVFDNLWRIYYGMAKGGETNKERYDKVVVFLMHLYDLMLAAATKSLSGRVYLPIKQVISKEGLGHTTVLCLIQGAGVFEGHAFGKNNQQIHWLTNQNNSFKNQWHMKNQAVDSGDGQVNECVLFFYYDPQYNKIYSETPNTKQKVVNQLAYTMTANNGKWRRERALGLSYIVTQPPLDTTSPRAAAEIPRHRGATLHMTHHFAKDLSPLPSKNVGGFRLRRRRKQRKSKRKYHHRKKQRNKTKRKRRQFKSKRKYRHRKKQRNKTKRKCRCIYKRRHKKTKKK